ncbi:MAG: C45 family autoproteolytic acyltransferase/hydrolase, partial [Planctomycetota bacterium]
PGPPGESGFVHGRLIADLLSPAFVEAYLRRLAPINRFTLDDVRVQASRWLDGLPVNFQEEIDGMARGSGRPLAEVAAFLYADIARATRDVAVNHAYDAVRDPELGNARGPMCSAVVSNANRCRWASRNCDWLTATLMRGTSCVVHAVPNRIPVMAVGIRGDIDIDTGMNAEGLWLHLHTLLAKDDPPRDRTCISWLFWAREALERCATLDELEAFIHATGRDRGVIAIAVEGKTGDAAVFECTKADARRVDAGTEPLFATNHTLAKVIDEAREAKSRPGSTVGRFCALRSLLREHAPEHGPDDFIDLLAAEGVEMRTPEHLRTIYSAVANPKHNEVWFAAGKADGPPAASRGRWERVLWKW